METRDIIRKTVLPPLLKSISIEKKNTSSTGSSFGLGLSIAEKKKATQDADQDRFLVDFRLPRQIRSRMHERKFQKILDETFFPSSSQQQQLSPAMIKNAIQIQCAESDVVSQIPKEIREIFEMENDKSSELERFDFLQRLKFISMDSLAADPAPLFASFGIEKPFGAPSKRSTFSGQKMDKLMIESGGRNEGNCLENSSSSSSALSVQDQQQQQEQQRDDQSLALPSSSPASELAPWRLRGTNFSDYRRNMYTIGTDSIFSVGNVARPIRLASLNFLSFQADAVLEKYFYGHIYQDELLRRQNNNVPQSIFPHVQFLTEDDAEEAWQSAMQNSKRAIEACSTLFHERSVVVMSLLRKKKGSGGREKFAVMGGSSPTQAGSMQHQGGSAKFKNEYGMPDRELDTFVRHLRSGFGSVEVLPMRRAPKRNNIMESFLSGSGHDEMKSSSSSASRDKLNFEPVVVVCSSDGGGSSSRGVLSAYRLDTLPGNDRARLGELVGGGNQARLEDHYRTKGEYVDRRNPNDKNAHKVKFQINRFVSGYHQSHSAKHYFKTLKPEKLLSNLNRAGSVMSADKSNAQVRAETNKKVADIYRDFTTPKTSSGTILRDVQK